MVQHPTSFGTSSILARASNFSSNTSEETLLLKASRLLRLSLWRVTPPSTWGKSQPIGATQPSTSALWVTQCLRLQGELSTNLLRLSVLRAHHKWFRERSLVMKMIKMEEQGCDECLTPKRKQKFSVFLILLWSHVRMNLGDRSSDGYPSAWRQWVLETPHSGPQYGVTRSDLLTVPSHLSNAP